MIKQEYPLLWTFFDGAFSANSGGRAQEADFVDFTPAQLQQAEEELFGYVRNAEDAHWIGMQADSGYTVTRMPGSPEEGDLEGEQIDLLAFTLLTTRY